MNLIVSVLLTWQIGQPVVIASPFCPPMTVMAAHVVPMWVPVLVIAPDAPSVPAHPRRWSA